MHQSFKADRRVESDLQAITWSLYLPTPTDGAWYVWVHLLLWQNQLKVQRLVSEKNNSRLTIIVNETLFIPRHPVHLFGLSFLLTTVSLSRQGLEEKLIPVTIFWIFSSFFRMLDLTAQILSCWSLISCSSSASSDFRGSTALSVTLQHKHANTHNNILKTGWTKINKQTDT